MAYLKPPWFTTKIFNPIAMVTGIADTETLTVTKRGSKQPQKIPVLTVDVGDTKYLDGRSVTRGRKVTRPFGSLYPVPAARGAVS